MALATDIETALFNAVYAFIATLNPALPYEMPNRTLDPPEDGKYLVISLFKNDTDNIAWSTPSMYQGILQIMINWPVNAGSGEMTDLADLIVAYFRKGTVFRYGSAVVKIEVEPSVLSLLQDGHKAQIPVSVRYRCFG